MDESESPTITARALSRSVIHKILESELGQNWRSIRWWSRQFTPVSTTILITVLTASVTWIINLSHKVDNQSTKIVVLETEIVPDLKLTERVGALENHDANHEGRIGANERDISQLQGVVGQFDYDTAVHEAGKPLQLHGHPIEPPKDKRH
jgi:hypothetical protein